MKLDVHLTDEDYIRFNIFHMFNSPQGKKSVLIGRLAGFFVAILAVVIFLIAGAETGLLITEIGFLIAFSVVWYLGYPSSVKRRTRKTISRMKVSGRLPYNADSVVEFGDDEIISESERGREITKYSSINGIYEDESCVYLYKGAMEAIILPDSCLPEGREGFLKFIKGKCKGCAAAEY